jgi:hypothetical protein
MLLLAAWCARGVILKRLQAAVAASLLVHIILCFAMHTVRLDLPTPVAADELPGESREELTLPDHGGMEIPDHDVAPWSQPSQAPAPETVVHIERQAAEAVRPERPEPAEVERPPEVARPSFKIESSKPSPTINPRSQTVSRSTGPWPMHTKRQRSKWYARCPPRHQRQTSSRQLSRNGCRQKGRRPRLPPKT